MEKMCHIRICNETPQAELIIVGDVVGTKFADGMRGIVYACSSEEQFKVVTEDGIFEDWINPVKFGTNYEIAAIWDLVAAVIDL